MTTDTIDLKISLPAEPSCEVGVPAFWYLDEASAPTAAPAARDLADWVRTYLMRPHADLGRTGPVCPFTAQAAKLSLLRIGISQLDGSDKAGILSTMRGALAVFDGLSCNRSTRVFRTLIVGFPACSDARGIATLRQVQNALRHHSIIGARMIGLFEPNSPAEGLINADFRPLRSPVPALAIRMLVEQDAPFVVRNPLLVPVYLSRFPLAGSRRLVACGLLSHIAARLMSRLNFGARDTARPAK